MTVKDSRLLTQRKQLSIALGVKPVNALANILRGKVKRLYLVGDAEKPGRIREAISSWFMTAYHL